MQPLTMTDRIILIGLSLPLPVGLVSLLAIGTA
jgi:hypothetical protein